MDDLFIGSAVSRMGANGVLPLSIAFCTTIQSRGAKEQLFVGLDEDARCLVVYDRAGVTEHHSRRDMQAMRDDCSPAVRNTMRRRLLGSLAQTRLDGRGRITVAPWSLARRGVAYRTLLVGMGDHFEIWDLDHVLAHGPSELAALAALHATVPLVKESRDEPDLQPVQARRGTRRPVQPGVPVQPLPALSPGPDPVVHMGRC